MTTVRLIASTLRRLHALPQLADIPEWVAARDALAAVQALTLDDQPSDTLANIGDAIADTCRAGEPVDVESLTTRIVDIDRRADAQAQLHTARSRAESILLGELDKAAAAAVPAVLSALHTDMRDVCTRLAQVSRPDQLEDVTTADAAGRLDDYRQLRELRDRYTNIRTAQAIAYEHTPGTSTQHAAVHLIRAQETLMPGNGWAAAHRGSSYRNPNGELVMPLPVPWPADFAPSVHAALTDARFLDWALENPTALGLVWVPTPAEITSESRRLDDLLEQARPSTVLATRERVTTDIY